jgi:hypothetical protein
MAAQWLSMRKLRELFWLRFEAKLSARASAAPSTSQLSALGSSWEPVRAENPWVPVCNTHFHTEWAQVCQWRQTGGGR